MDFIKLDNEYVSNTYKRQNIVIESGKSSTATDVNGKKYIDFSSGIGVNSLGFCNDAWVNAITQQANNLQHCSNLYYSTPQIALAEKLCIISSFKKVFFANSGAEANEGAIKTARKYSFDKYGENRFKILTLENSFHGRTISTLKATGQSVFHNYFFPFTEGFEYAIANDYDSVIKKLSENDFCAVLLEVVQGEGGVISLDKDFVKKVETYCKEHDILLIIDEVQTGIGRTGTLFAHEQYDISPDIVTLAKGLGGGLPIGGVLFAKSTENVLKYSDHGTTFGGNPIVCAGANVVLDNLDLESIKEKGAYIKDKLLNMPKVASVSGLGLMIGIELNDVEVGFMLEECLKNGLIILSAKTKLRMLPPLNITYDEIDKGLEILENILKKL